MTWDVDLADPARLGFLLEGYLSLGVVPVEGPPPPVLAQGTLRLHLPGGRVHEAPGRVIRRSGPKAFLVQSDSLPDLSMLASLARQAVVAPPPAAPAREAPKPEAPRTLVDSLLDTIDPMADLAFPGVVPGKRPAPEPPSAPGPEPVLPASSSLHGPLDPVPPPRPTPPPTPLRPATSATPLWPSLAPGDLEPSRPTPPPAPPSRPTPPPVPLRPTPPPVPPRPTPFPASPGTPSPRESQSLSRLPDDLLEPSAPRRPPSGLFPPVVVEGEAPAAAAPPVRPPAAAGASGAPSGAPSTVTGRESEYTDVYARVKDLPLADKQRLARHGRRTVRQILMRDPNKTLQRLVLGNPDIGLDEVQEYAGWPGLAKDALEFIAGHSTWMASRMMILAVIRNPSAPMDLAIRLVPRLGPAEWRLLVRPGAVRTPIATAARKALEAARDS